MRNTLIAAVAMAVLHVPAAFAGQDQYPANLRATDIVASRVQSETGNEAAPPFGAPIAIVTAGGVEAPNASNAPVQSTNSLPAGALEGTATHAYALSMQRHFAVQTNRRYADRSAHRS